jgi:predicted small lipoprotein YifL
MRVGLLLALLGLAACGIDGPPTPPEGSVSVGGDARVGVVGEL